MLKHHDQLRSPTFPFNKIFLTSSVFIARDDCIRLAGLRLLGFKSVSMLKHHHQLRSPTFLYPDERSVPGSTQTFIALHAAMLKKDRMAICSFVRAKAAEPRLVALLPQQEELEDGIQVRKASPAVSARGSCYGV